MEKFVMTLVKCGAALLITWFWVDWILEPQLKLLNISQPLYNIIWYLVLMFQFSAVDIGHDLHQIKFKLELED